MRVPSLALAAAFASSLVQAQELAPRDYSPNDEMPIKVVRLDETKNGTTALVTIGNRTSGPREAGIDCSLYGPNSEPLGVMHTFTQGIPPQSEIVETLRSPLKGIGKAFCRVAYSR